MAPAAPSADGSAAQATPNHKRPAGPSGADKPAPQRRKPRPFPAPPPVRKKKPYQEPKHADIDLATAVPESITFIPATEAALAALSEAGIELDGGDAEKLGLYLAMLIAANSSVNLTAITDPAEGWMRHIADSLMVLPLVASLAEQHAEALGDAAASDPLMIIDVGTGGGLPGIPLAIAMPSVRVTLLEATGKKVQFLNLVKARLGLKNVRVIQARAEQAGQEHRTHRERYDIAVARAVGALPVLVEYLAPFVKLGGVALAIKGEKAEQEVSESGYAFNEVGLEFDQILPTATSRVVIMAKTVKTPRPYPRRDGEPSRVPLVMKVAGTLGEDGTPPKKEWIPQKGKGIPGDRAARAKAAKAKRSAKSRGDAESPDASSESDGFGV